MLKIHKKIQECLSEIRQSVASDISDIRFYMEHTSTDVRRANFGIQAMLKRIEDIENLLFDTDTKIVIHQGKKYRITGVDLSQTPGEANSLTLDCVEVQE